MRHIAAIALGIIAPVCMFHISCASSSCLKGMPSCIEIHPPAIHITGEKTALERQLIGEYKEIEKDGWVASSVMVPSKGQRQALGNVDREVMEALQIRELNYDKIRVYKDKGLLGEQRDGYVSVIDEKALLAMKDHTIVRTIVHDENNARQIIFIKNTSSNKKDDPRAIQFGYDFAREQRARAKKGDWIQLEDGRWVKK